MSLPSVITPPLLRAGRAATLVLLALAILPHSAYARQTDQEPILDQVRSMFSSPGMTVRFLGRISVDGGVDGATERVRADQARLRVQGMLDGGFTYLIQTNFSGGSHLLDARVGWTRDESFYAWAGQFKTPYSQEFIDYIGVVDFAYRSRVVSALAPNRQLGVQLGGALTDVVSWSLGGFTGSTATASGEPLLGVLRLDGTGIEVGDGTLRLAGQAAFGRDGAAARFAPGFSGDGMLFGVDARYESGALMLAGEFHRGEWTPDIGPEGDADGLFLTAGWMVQDDRQILARWDRYRAPGSTLDDDVLVLGLNVWPTRAAKLQANWQVPLRDSSQLHRLLFIFQVGI